MSPNSTTEEFTSLVYVTKYRLLNSDIMFSVFCRNGRGKSNAGTVDLLYPTYSAHLFLYTV